MITLALLALLLSRLHAFILLVIVKSYLLMNGVKLMLKLDMSLLMKLDTILVWTMTFQPLTQLLDVMERVSWAMAIHQMHGLLAASRTCKLIILLTKTIGAWNVSIHKKIASQQKYSLSVIYYIFQWLQLPAMDLAPPQLLLLPLLLLLHQQAQLVIYQTCLDLMSMAECTFLALQVIFLHMCYLI